MSTGHWKLPTIVMVSGPALDLIVQYVRAGAVDVMVKSLAAAELAGKVSSALEVDRLAKEHNADKLAKLDQFTAREREVLMYYLRAETTKAIAAKLGISPKTVEKHRAHILEKLGFESVAELLRYFLTGS
jgi:FixJ family two-component response regulator